MVKIKLSLDKGGIGETKQIIINEEVCEAVQKEESFVEILEAPTTTTVKILPDNVFNWCALPCITWAEANGFLAIII